ncbi:hypothetical protein Metbo_2236 [Methanobacterium lacus]|uniref:DUF4004 family protein n=1 Tax=Methanobacterium lacus (strain AL-21) TaxID=877455 RepID=F0TCR0_METLA|nr:YhbD family protein [Methanobacterium lacus]ADZ10450.1 hypothetical protein Metbo_2236 [Methanobacterium lacus]
MSQDLISKKELLEITGISYGQLYRWKRKKLIPEEWFIKKSTFTGQETFFPKYKVIDRVEKIKNMKGDISLDSLADMLSPDLTEKIVSEKELKDRNIVSEATLEFTREEYGETKEFRFEQIISIYLLDKMFKSGKIGHSEGKIVFQLFSDKYQKFKGKNCELIFFRKMGVSSCCMVPDSKDVHFEETIKIMEIMNISELIEELKIKMF